MMELKQFRCVSCGAPVDRRTMKCEYCGSDYSYENNGYQTRFIVDRPGVHTIRCEARVDMRCMRHSPETAKEYALREMRNQVADGLLAYMKFTTSEDYDPMSLCQIIRGEVRVVDPSFNY